jgi:hypothetical protein
LHAVVSLLLLLTTMAMAMVGERLVDANVRDAGMRTDEKRTETTSLLRKLRSSG